MERSERTFAIERAAYGKAAVRVLAGPADPDGPLLDAEIAVTVEGAFTASYTHGDNAAVLPSDTLRRHALAESAAWPGDPIEALAGRISARVRSANPAFDTVTVTAVVREWAPSGPDTWARTAAAHRVGVATGPDGTPAPWGAVELELLAGGGSAFAGFFRDPLTVQGDAADRPLAASVGLRWTIDAGGVGTGAVGDTVSAVTAAAAGAFGAGPSRSVQERAHRMAAAVLDAVPYLSGVELTLRAEPLVPVPPELLPPGPAPVLAHEWGSGPVGVTEISLRAEP